MSETEATPPPPANQGAVLLAADGSPRSTAALQAGLALLAPDAPCVLVTVMHAADPMLVSGTGFAGGTMTPDEYDVLQRDQEALAAGLLHSVAEAIGRPGIPSVILEGDPGLALCDYATEIGARAIVIGSRGRGGFRRALLGSVSDHVVRHAHCPVIVSSHPDVAD